MDFLLLFKYKNSITCQRKKGMFSYSGVPSARTCQCFLASTSKNHVHVWVLCLRLNLCFTFDRCWDH